MLLSVVGCRQDHKELVTPNTDTCVTTGVTFADISPIFERNCSSCHNELETEAGAKSWGAFGSIVGAVKHDPAYMPMPKFSPKLSDCEIKKIEAWYLMLNAQR